MLFGQATPLCFGYSLLLKNLLETTSAVSSHSPQEPRHGFFMKTFSFMTTDKDVDQSHTFVFLLFVNSRCYHNSLAEFQVSDAHFDNHVLSQAVMDAPLVHVRDSQT